jgi:hypothetical protein
LKRSLPRLWKEICKILSDIKRETIAAAHAMQTSSDSGRGELLFGVENSTSSRHHQAAQNTGC